MDYKGVFESYLNPHREEVKRSPNKDLRSHLGIDL